MRRGRKGRRKRAQRGGLVGVALGGLGMTLAKALAGTAASTLIPAVGKAIVSGFKRPPRYTPTNPAYMAKEREMAGRAGKLLADKVRSLQRGRGRKWYSDGYGGISGIGVLRGLMKAPTKFMRAKRS
jgi:hypothetical protein